MRRKERFLLREDRYEDWMMFAVERGSFKYDVGEAGQASFGEIVVCPPGVTLRREVVTPLAFHYILFSWERGREEVSTSKEAFPAGKIAFQDTNRLTSTYSHLRTLEHREDPIGKQLKNHLLYDLWCLYRLESSSARKLVEDKTVDPLMRLARSSIRRYAYGSLSMEELAASLDLSPVQLTRKFRSSFRVTPSQYLTSIRLQKARELLLETDSTLDEIARHCGYRNGFYLSRVFSKNMNMSPSLFRKMYRV